MRIVSNVKVLAGASGLLLALVLVMCLVLPALTQSPPPPESFWGTVTLNGGQAPAGTLISAHVNGVEVATTTVDSQGRYGER